MKLGILLTSLAFLAAVETRADFDQANAAFIENRYAEAAAGYETVIRAQGYSAAVLFNLANAYHQDGQLGRAILNYERAQLLAPEAGDIARNLRIARRKAGIANPPAHWLGACALSGLCSLAAITIAAGFLFRPVIGSGGWGWIAVNTVVLLASMFALLVRHPEREPAVVLVNQTPAYVAPVSAAPPIFTVSAGQPVSIRKVEGSFLLVEAGRGRRGWMSAAAVERVIPT